MRLNQNNDLFIYRGETAAIDFKISQRSDYYVPFLISSARVNPMVCITIGSSRREGKNIISRQLWLELDTLLIPRFTQTTVSDLETLSAASEANITDIIEPGIMYQFKREAEVEAGNPQLHFVYEEDGVAKIDEYHFTVIMALDESITLDLTDTNYLYQIELMDTEPMITHIQSIFTTYPELINKMPDAFTNTTLGITNYKAECIAVINKTFPNHWGHRINDPVSSPVASVSAIQIIQAPRRFIVESVVR